MKIVPYEEKYYTDVMNCLSRNFRTMSGLEEGEVYDIVKGIFSYPWIDSDIPYSRGVVLLDNEENLVGYLGAVYTRKLVSERWLTICNFSTWAIDSKFRIFVFSCLKEFHRTADVFLDYSPNEASIQIERQMFMYKDIENEIFVFKPHPYIGAGSLKVRIIRDESKIYDEDVRKKYLDHKGLGVKCCEVITPDGIPQYMFYDILIEKVHKIPTRWIKVLEVSDETFFGDCATEVIGKLQSMELAFLETDARFFNGDNIQYDYAFSRRKTTRLAYSPYLDLKNLKKSSLLYSEVVLIKRNR